MHGFLPPPQKVGQKDSKNTSAAKFFSSLADQLKRRPIKGIGELFPNGLHRNTQSSRLAGSGTPCIVKAAHELSRALIIDVPKAHNQRACACIQKCPLQTK